MTSVKVKFRPSGIQGKTGSIFLQIIHRRTVRIQKTTYKIYPNEWDGHAANIICPLSGTERFLVLQRYRQALTQDLSRLKECVNDIARRRTSFSADDILKHYRNRIKNNTLSSFMNLIIQQLKEQGRVRTSETYQCALDRFIRFREGEDIGLDEIEQDVVEAYESYLKREKLSLNTISFYMRILRATYNRAVEKELITQRHPFRHVYTGIEKTIKRAVPIRVIKNIKEETFQSDCSIGYARDMFLFSFYTRGMSFVDMAYLKKKDLHKGILTYRRKKTGQQLCIKWEPCMQEIIDKYPTNSTEYLLPIIMQTNGKERLQYRNSLTLINRKLKTLSSLIRSPYPLSMYVARHSWASIAKSKNIPISIISEGMGHDSESTTQIYLASWDTTVVDRANHLILNEL
ncbi:MAG: site-specific integrase [Paraprevotella sp.]|nr:site-specific integrase [Paraprevotella sp.]